MCNKAGDVDGIVGTKFPRLTRLLYKNDTYRK